MKKRYIFSFILIVLLVTISIKCYASKVSSSYPKTEFHVLLETLGIATDDMTDEERYETTADFLSTFAASPDSDKVAASIATQLGMPYSNDLFNTNNGISEYVNEGVPLYTQDGDVRWSFIKYHAKNQKSDKTIGHSGCGPTSMSMALTGLLGGIESEAIYAAEEKLRYDVQEHNATHPGIKIDLYQPNDLDGQITPDEAAAMSTLTGGRAIGQGSYGSMFTYIAEKYFDEYINVRAINASELSNELSTGKNKGKVVVLHSREGYFTNGGHYLLAIGIKEVNGYMYVVVRDPNKNNGNYNKAYKCFGDYIPLDMFKLEAVLDSNKGNIISYKVIERKHEIFESEEDSENKEKNEEGSEDKENDKNEEDNNENNV